MAKVKIIFFLSESPCSGHGNSSSSEKMKINFSNNIFQDPGVVNVVAKLILLLTRKIMSFVLITT